MSDDSLSNYIKVGSNISTFVQEKITPITPIISNSDKQIGEISRYFVRFSTHLTSADITEIDKKTFNRIKSNKLYNCVLVRWIISGPLDDFEKSNILMPGVVTANQRSIELANEKLPGLKDYISNYQRFWQPT